MKRVGAYEAKTHLSRLLDEVEKGGRFAITRHGVTVAELVPPSRIPRPRHGDVVAAFEAASEGKRLGKIGLRTLIEEGRRF